jgi:hypothetical protein
MKSILLGAIAAIIVAIGSYAVLDQKFQQTADEHFITTGARL